MPSMLRDYAIQAPDPALTSLWLVQIGNGGAVTYLIAEQMTATFPKIPANARFSSGSNNYFPGLKDVDSVSITFYESHDYQVSQWLKTWALQVCDENGNYGAPSVYKQTICLNLFSKPSSKPVQVVNYQGCWPTDKNAFELNYSDDTGRLVVQATFAVDSVSY